jgi:tetratricopeptide (TPR) repeat protein
VKKLGHVLFAVSAAAMMTLPDTARGDEFYESRLKSGEAAFLDKRPTEAIDNLRIAAFGLLEYPPLECEALVYLALAESGAGKNVDADATLARFLDVERRFAPFAKARVDPTIRASFQSLLLSRVNPSTLLAIPGLAGLVETEEQRIAKLPPKERWKAYEAAARREPREPRWALDLARESFALSDLKAAIAWSTRALELDPSSAEGHSLRAHALVLSGDCAAAKADLQALSAADLEGRPTLVADRFVCLVELKDWTPAAEAARALPESQAGRADVIKARQKLAAERVPSR